jgi:hypothetical protein
MAIPYSQEYRAFLDTAAGHLRKAAALTGNASCAPTSRAARRR